MVARLGRALNIYISSHWALVGKEKEKNAYKKPGSKGRAVKLYYPLI